MRAGFVGLGNQGGPMAMRIAQSGIALSVWARRREVLSPFVEAGASAAEDLAQLGRESDVLGVCVFGDRDVQEIARAVLPAMRARSVLLVHSTVHPETVRQLAEHAGTRQVGVLDAPVSGGGAAAAKGELTVLVGGLREHLEKARPVIETYAGLIAHLGELGSGAIAKLVNNAMMAANLSTAHEAMRAGEALGLDREALRTVVAAASGASYAHQHYCSRGSLADFTHSVALLAKDVDLLESVVAAAHDDVDVLARHARNFFDQVVAFDRG